MYLYNCPEYLQSTFAAVKVGLVPVNTNYRYGDDELSYLWDNADAVAVVFHGSVRRADRGHPRPGTAGQGLALGRRRHAARAPSGPPPTTTRRSRPSAGCARAVGTQRRRPLHALHRRHDRHAQGRHVAPGRSLRPPHRQRGAPLPRRRRPRGGARRHRGAARAARPCCRPARSCTGPATSPPTPCWPRAAGSACSSRAATTRSSCSTRSSARR